MSNMTSRRIRTRLRDTLLRGSLGLALLLTTSAWAGGHVIHVRPPNGVDDTANLQAALDMAVTSGPGCTVQLAKGKYLTQQLVTYNFHGTFRGEGRDKTTIEALPNLVVNAHDFCVDVKPINGTTNRWPSLITFVDGDIAVSDVAIKVPATNGTATTPWPMCGDTYTNLIDVLRFMGQNRTQVTVDRITIEGSPDDSPTSNGFNAWNGVMFAGEHPRVPYTHDVDYYFLSGSLTVRNSTFRSLFDGVCVDGFIKNAKVTVGGSPGAGNVMEYVLVGLDMEGAETSLFEISYNRCEGQWNGMWVVPWCCWTPTQPSYYSIHDNTFITAGPYANGIYLGDDAANPWIRATIYNNTIELKSDFMWAGIGAYNTRGTVIWNNNISGMGADAIRLGGSSTFCTVIGNHVDGFFADPSFGLAKIYLGPASSRNLVVCPSPLDTVLDRGTDNKVIGGWPQGKTSAEGLALKSSLTPVALRPSFKKNKPLPQ